MVCDTHDGVHVLCHATRVISPCDNFVDLSPVCEMLAHKHCPLQPKFMSVRLTAQARIVAFL